MDFIDYYKMLELDKSATKADIKKAYRRLARKYHPDLNPNDKEAQLKFQQLNEAHKVLSDPEKRRKYDQYGKDWQHAGSYQETRKQQQAPGGQAYSGGGFQGSSFSGQSGYSYSGNFDEDTFSDFFEEMFGSNARSQGSGRGRHFKGQDLNAELQLNLNDVYQDHQQTLNVNGRNIRLNIPAGVENGQTIKIKGHGGPGIQGGPHGDLYITFKITNHTKFKREKENLFCNIEIDLYTALLGGEITLDTFSGKAKLKVKPETKPGTKVKLKGKGFPKYKKEGEIGDLIITYIIKMPTQLSSREKDLFKELQKLRS